MWWMVAYWVVTIAIAAYAIINQPKIQPPSPAGLQDFDVPKAEDGALMPILFGTKDVKAINVLWYGDLNVVPVKAKGGKK